MDSNSFYYYLGYISTLFSAFSFFVGLLCIKSIKGFLVPLFLIVSISFVIEIVNVVLVRSNINNLIIFRFYTVVEFILISFFYYIFFRKYFRSSYFLIAIPLFLIIAFIDYKINGLNSLDNFSSSIGTILLSLNALFSFLFVIRKLLFENILSEPFFWINSGILFYFSGNLLVFSFSNYFLATELSNHSALWSIPQFLNIVYNILISIGFWKARAK